MKPFTDKIAHTQRMLGMNGIELIKVTSKKEQKEFVNFPLRLYKGNKFFVPPLYGDELKIFTDKNIYNKTCESVYFLAKKDGKTVGRIQGILQKQFNEIQNKTQVRFTRFDAIDSNEVASLLFSAVENWAKEKCATEVVGPLGYSDLEREGLLIDGFEELATFEEQYNYPYYQKLIESCGYDKDVDWVEYKIFPEVYKSDTLSLLGDRAMKKYNLHLGGEGLSKRAFIKKYKDGIFNCLDVCYKELYGTVPFTEEMKKQMLEQFLLVLNLKYLFVILDENENVVSFGLGIPAIGEAVQKSGGKLTIPTIIRLLKAVKRPKGVDLALVGILPQYQKTGLNAVIVRKLQEIITSDGIEYMESNLNLEENIAVQGQWKYFKHVNHKRRRAFKKVIG